MEREAEIVRSGSERENSSSIWRTDSADIFSKSVREEDDEEALKWAALEKLNTYSRVRRGIYIAEKGDVREVDIKKLGIIERKQLLERLVKIAEQDNENFLRKLKNRIDRVGLDIPTIEVRFEHLNVEAKVYVGSRGLPTVFNFFSNAAEAFLNYLHILPSRKKPLQILQDVSGIIKPRRLTLLLGPPSSGKTSLLLALAAKLDPDLKVSGIVTYNGHRMNEFVPQRSSAYISQHDLHIGEMTVRETLAFSARCQGIGARYDMLTELARREKEANIKPDPDIDIYMKAAAMEEQQAFVATDYIMKILGLETCADTLIGNHMIRGISGGQKKRVTTGEMLVGPAKTLLMDEISTGLDSSTTFQIVNALRQSIHILNGTAVTSLLQPAPETYDLFDDIILLSEGRIVYQGPRENVLEFFEEMGFKCPERKGVADFLQEVTSKKDQQQYWAHRDEPYRFITVKELAEAFQSFNIGQSLREELSHPFDKTKSHPAALTTKKYGATTKELLKACMSREVLLMKRNSFIYVFKAIQLTTLACICMTVFLRTTMHRNTILDGGLYMGAQYFAVTTIMFNGNAEMSMTISRLPVLYKQRDFQFYPAWAYAIPSWLVKIPLQLTDGAVWVALTYYVIGFDPSIERFFKQYLLFVSLTQMAMGLFRFIGAVARDIIVSNTCGSAALMVVLNLGGFLLSGDNVKPWWKWAYWCSPIMYAQNAIGVNEFLGRSWDHVPPNSSEPLGIQILKARGMFTEARWYWIGIGALIGFSLLFNLLYILALSYLHPIGKPRPILSEASLAERNASGTEVDIIPSSKQIRDAEGSGSRTRMNISSRNRGMILPFEPLSLTFDEVKYAVDMPQGMKDQGIKDDKLQLLNGVSGAFRPGVLTALMGVSGAGKTTLMDVLAGRKTGGYIEGFIKISGYSKNQKTFARIAGYCEQTDIHTPQVTVYESLLYSAWLRLSPDVDDATRKMFIEEVMELVELTSLRGALVGLPGVDGLSTEQRKRLTIAVELVANPSIIFMDEPTSGLDARAAAIVMRAVRNTVDTGRTVVCTIHQPSIDIFDVFDELVLLKRGGQQIYVGALGQHCSQLIKYFEDITGVKMKNGQNPATWMLEVTSPAKEEILGIDFAETYKNSDLCRRNKEIVKELSTPPPGSKDLLFPTQYSQSYFTQFRACLWKKHWSYWRTPRYNAVRIVFVIFVALLYGTIYWDIGTKRRNIQDINNAMGSMYASVIFLGIQNTLSVQPILTIDRAVLYRERAAGMYAALPYAFAQALIEIPYILTQSILYGCIIYSTIGFEWEIQKFFCFLYFMFVALLYDTYFGLMAVAATPNQNVAYVATSALFSIWNLFSGFLIPVSRLPIWWRWNYYLSPFAWTLYGLAGSQFADVQDRLPNGQTVQQFLESYFGFHHDFIGYVALIVAGFALLFCFVFIFSIRSFNFQTR
uniref:ABC transporter domain-containing protein n=1 Tax=Kalanchoe fedtschenkoi TaxID=63787 RepID=A0A7N0V1X9_KALFE